METDCLKAIINPFEASKLYNYNLKKKYKCDKEESQTAENKSSAYVADNNWN